MLQLESYCVQVCLLAAGPEMRLSRGIFVVSVLFVLASSGRATLSKRGKKEKKNKQKVHNYTYIYMYQVIGMVCFCDNTSSVIKNEVPP